MSKPYTQMTKQELLKEGFGEWDNDLMLIPNRLYDKIPNGTQVVSIGGEAKTKESTSGEYTINGARNPNYIDRDTRGGMLAYGIYPQV